MSASEHGYATAAAWWDADVGPPSAQLLDRPLRAGAPFSMRILAHAVDELRRHAPTEVQSRPWVHGVMSSSRDEARPLAALHRGLRPVLGPVLVRAGAAVGPMALLEALGHLSAHDAVLVTYGQDAVPPHHEALAVAVLLTRRPMGTRSLMLHPPILQSTLSHLDARTTEHPLMPMVRLARAIKVGQPTIETIDAVEPNAPDHSKRWRIEVRRPD